MNILLEIICLAILSAPLIWEVRDDKHGDNNKIEDVVYRGALMLAAAGMVTVLTYHSYVGSLLMTFAIFFLVFDYAMNIRLVRSGIYAGVGWFAHLGKSSVLDRWEWWKNLNPWYRFAIRVGVLVVAIIVYF